jgi:hypothetical protein
MNNAHKWLPITLAVAMTTGWMAQARAGELNDFSTLSQTEFLALSKDLAAATSTRAVEPAAPLGLTGFDISVSASATQTQANSAWTKAAGSNADQLVQTKVSLSKGLPWGIDVGGFTSKVASSNATASGFHVKYAVISGNAVMPAVALRVSHSRMGGVSQMALTNTGYEALISKGFLGLTPYAGIGIVNSTAKVNGVASLNNESFKQHKTFVGASWNILLLNVSAEYDRIGEASTYSLKAGLRF